MNIVVQKFGGSSVKDKECLEHVISKIENSKEKGNNVVVVVSAQGKTTDGLISKAKEYTDKNYTKEMDLLLSTGEIQTVALLTMMLKDRGHEAVGLTGGQAGVITDSNFSYAKIKMIMSENIIKHLEGGKIVVVAGFQGIDKFGNITTLGRGGSDLSAVAIAAALKAKKCEIYTDVDGVFSADPNVIGNAKLIENISYDEMLEAATAGAKVLHNRSVGIAKKYKMKVMVKNTRGNKEGTLVYKGNDDVSEDVKSKIIAVEKDLSKISVIGQNFISNPQYITKIYETASKMNIVIHILNLSETKVSIIVKEKDAKEFANILHEKLIFNE